MNNKTITSLEKIVPDIDYDIKAIVYKVDKEGESEKKRPISLILQFEDGGRKFKACTWDYSMLDTFKEVCEKRLICNFTIKGSPYKDSMNFKITNFQQTTKVSELPVEKQYDGKEEIENIKENIKNKMAYVTNPNYLAILNQLIIDNESFFIWKAAKSIHHAFVGGLALHSVAVCDNAINLANLYLDKNGFTVDYDLLITGALLHDIGKIREYTQDGEFSFEGQLLSHLISGIEMIDDACNFLNIDKYGADILKLKHIIASHHGKLEFGSPNTPMTPEAYFIHFADYNDSSVEAMLETLQNINTGDLSGPIKSLNDGKVFKLY